MTAEGKKYIDLTLGKRPAEELYDLRNDPHQLINLAHEPRLAETRTALAKELQTVMTKTKDPRLSDAFDKPPYVANGQRSPRKSKSKSK